MFLHPGIHAALPFVENNASDNNLFAEMVTIGRSV